MLPLLAVAALGFSLEGAGRQLADAPAEVCKSGCDAGHDASCDEQDLKGEWTRGCDMHPTTSCDEDCHYSPPPPKAPWLGEHGTYPSPPPSPSPQNHQVVIYTGIALIVAIVFLCCVCVILNYSGEDGDRSGTSVDRTAYWCCGCLPSRRNDNSWYYDEDRAQRAKVAVTESPGVPGMPNVIEEPDEMEGVLKVEARPTPTLALPTLALK